MSRTCVDLTGQTFGRLTVLRRIESRESDNGRAARFLCVCSCDSKTEKAVLGYALKNGNTRSCGCLRREAAARSAPLRARSKRTGLALTDDALRSLYEDQQLSSTAIAARLGVSPQTVLAWLRAAGVRRRSVSAVTPAPGAGSRAVDQERRWIDEDGEPIGCAKTSGGIAVKLRGGINGPKGRD